MKKIISIIFLPLLLFSCSEEDNISEIIKQDFYIEVKNIKNFWNSLRLNKTWKLASSQDIKLTSQASWRVWKIYVKEWEFVKKGDILAKLEDSVSNYWLALERALNWLNKAKINYESTENTLNKQISDLKINLSNLKIDENDSKSSLELEKIRNSIKKLALDYDNLKIANSWTISNFKNSMWKDLISFTTYIDNVIDFSDKLFWLTIQNRDKNDAFDNYLWAKDVNQRKISEDILLELISYRNNKLTNINFNFDGTDKFDSNIIIISDWYSILSNLLTNLDLTLNNSISSVWNLPESQIATFKSNIASFWSIYNLNNSSFIALKNSINSFLDTYRNTEESLLKQIWLLESDQKIYIKSLDVKLEIDESTLNEAISNKDLTLRQLNTIIVDSEIAYKQAIDNLSKLTIRTPISWNIWEIFIDVWQEVWIWAPLFNISNNSSSEVVISFSKNELDYIKAWDVVYVEFDWASYTWSIYSISNSADSNLKYLSRISFNDWVNFIWNIVNVSIPYNTIHSLIPLNIVKVSDNWYWFINIFNDWVISEYKIKLWNIYWDQIEILDIPEWNIDVILTNVSSFDSEKFILKSMVTL